VSTSGNEKLRISDLHAFYGESHILHGIDMHVMQGELVTLLGRNGSGRSTTLRSIMNMVGAARAASTSTVMRPLIWPLTRLLIWVWVSARKSAVFSPA
jgi:ABC-type histidine transport system ATPase subunit